MIIQSARPQTASSSTWSSLGSRQARIDSVIATRWASRSSNPRNRFRSFAVTYRSNFGRDMTTADPRHRRERGIWPNWPHAKAMERSRSGILVRRRSNRRAVVIVRRPRLRTIHTRILVFKVGRADRFLSRVMVASLEGAKQMAAVHLED